MPYSVWQAGRFALPLTQPKIMGIVNLTPDSFSDGGRHNSAADGIRHAEQLLADGADILDIGGESTRPGSLPVPPEEEWRRVYPVLAEAVRWNVPVSLDTRRALIMRQALDAGLADIINDVQGLEDPGALETLAVHPQTGICIMHMRGLPATMQEDPEYGNVVAEVAAYLRERGEAAENAGIAAERIVLDPGFGFGKTLSHNIALMQQLPELAAQVKRPLLIGVSRKRMIGELSGRDLPQERVSGSIAAALFALKQGAAVLRVHDVRETADAVKVWQGLQHNAAEI